jgi:hypothetical protein
MSATDEYFISSGIAGVLSQTLNHGPTLNEGQELSNVEACLHEAKDSLHKLTALLEPVYAHLSKRRVCWRELSQLLTALCHRVHR